MNRNVLLFALVLACLVGWPLTCPAPLVYRPGEGWTYESVGGGKWVRARAKDQYEVAKAAFDSKKYRLATKAARRTVKRWPLSDYAPQAQYVLARCYEGRRMDEKAFNEYQRLIEKYPKAENYDDVLHRQYEIANRFLAGQWFKLWGYIPFFPSMEKTADMYAKLIRNGPYSSVATQAQLKIGTAREKQKDYASAAKAYEKAADVYHDQKDVAAEATYRLGQARYKQATTAEYDQSVASDAITTFNDFILLFPNDPRVAEAQKIIVKLRTEQAQGSFRIAVYYEKKHQLEGALVYYNEVLIKDPDSKYATEAKQRIPILKEKVAAKEAAAKAAVDLKALEPIGEPRRGRR